MLIAFIIILSAIQLFTAFVIYSVSSRLDLIAAAFNKLRVELNSHAHHVPIGSDFTSPPYK